MSSTSFTKETQHGGGLTPSKSMDQLSSYQHKFITHNKQTLLVPAATASSALRKKDSNEAYSDNVDHDENNNDNDDDDDNESFDSLDSYYESSRNKLLAKSQQFTIAYEKDRGYRGTELQFFSFQRPHMRAFHASWICFFTSYFVQYSQAPLLVEIQKSLHLSKADIWWTNIWMMLGGLPIRFLLGPLCDKFGARLVMVTVLCLSAIPTALAGYVAVNLTTLTMIRCILGAMDAFVPSQYWITCQFVREVGGTAMAVAGGLGASGSAFTQVITGSFIYSIIRYCVTTTTEEQDEESAAIAAAANDDDDYLATTTTMTITTEEAITIATSDDDDNDLAWRLTLLFPAAMALIVSWYFYHNSDDCPLGNFSDVKKAGLMMERSAVDSFRAGVYNINSWILFLQFAGSCGVDCTMCNGAAIYFHDEYKQSIAAAGASAFLYGISAIYARGLGGWLSDTVSHKFALRGRLWAQLICMLIQGLLNIWFSRMDKLVPSLLVMVLFSIVVQMSMGTCFGIVPYVDGPNTGTIAGVVGAGGNAGGAILAWLFMVTANYKDAMKYMGYFTIIMALFTPFIVVHGYKGIIFGRDHDEGSASRKHHSPLLVPGKLGHSPHLVSLSAKRHVRR